MVNFKIVKHPLILLLENKSIHQQRIEKKIMTFKGQQNMEKYITKEKQTIMLLL